MSIPRVSVVMTTYNGDRFLSESIESILSQSFTDLELIVVDDGSTDSSASIIRSFCMRDSRVRGIFLDRNVGIPKAANRGLRAARAEYIARMDSDDLCHPDRLSKQVSYLDSHPDIYIVGCRSVRMMETGLVVSDKYAKKRRIFVPAFIRGRRLIARRMQIGLFSVLHATTIFRRSYIMRLGGYREIFKYGIDDYDLFMRVLVSYGAVFENISDKLYFYRLHYKRPLNVRKRLKLSILLKILIMYSANCRKHGVRDPLEETKQLSSLNHLSLSSNDRKDIENIIFLINFANKGLILFSHRSEELQVLKRVDSFLLSIQQPCYKWVSVLFLLRFLNRENFYFVLLHGWRKNTPKFLLNRIFIYSLILMRRNFFFLIMLWLHFLKWVVIKFLKKLFRRYTFLNIFFVF